MNNLFHRFTKVAAFVALVGVVGGLSGCGGGGGGGGSEGDIFVSGGTTTNPTTTTASTVTNTFSAGSPAPLNTSLNEAASLPGISLGGTTLSTAGGTGPGGSFAVGDSPSITFSLDTVNKAIVPGSGMPEKSSIAIGDLTYGEIYMSGPTTNYQRVIALQTNLLTASVRNSDGTYTYTLPAIPATYLAPYNDSASFGTTDGELQGQALQAGTYTIGIAVYKNYTVGTETVKDVANITRNVQLNTTAAEVVREVVKTDNCNRCHVTLQMHEGIRRDTKLCVLCHTSGAEDQNLTTVDTDGDGDIDIDDQTIGRSVDMRVHIHKIHNGAHLPSVRGIGVNADGTQNYAATPKPYLLVGPDDVAEEFDEVIFPVWPSLTSQMPRDLGYSAIPNTTAVNGSTYKTNDDNVRLGVVACYKCHGDPDGTGSLTAPSQGSLHQIPSRRACGSCHDDIDWTLPYQANGLTMAANQPDATCATCHAATGAATAGNPLSVEYAHTHPNFNTDAAIWPTNNPGLNFSITGIADSTATNLVTTAAQNGDNMDITYTVKNDAGTDVSLATLTGVSVIVKGPTTNPQYIMPYNAPTAVSISPYDFAGRLTTTSTSGKGSMSQVFGATATEVLVVQVTGATTFTVSGIAPSTGAVAWGPTPGAFAATTSHSFGVSLATVILSSSAVAQTITVDFSSTTAFTVLGSASGAMGSGTLPSATRGSMRFTSTDGTVAFNLTSGTTNSFVDVTKDKLYLTVFQGPVSNPATFAIIVGTTAFSSAVPDRFYYETVPAAASYTLRIPMDIKFELLGEGNGAAAQALTAAGNLPVHYGRQLLYERTAFLGAAQTLSAAAASYDRYITYTTIDAAWTSPGASGTSPSTPEYMVINDGGATEEYLEVGYIDTTNKRVWFSTPLRYAHLALETIQEITLTYKQEGTSYTLNPATGVVTSVIAFGNTNPIVMSYRTAGKFGWVQKPGGAAETKFFPPANDSPDLGQANGDWSTLAYQSGTYRAWIWGVKSFPVALQNEVQSYNGTSNSAIIDFLYGTATSITPHSILADMEACNTCHDSVMFHGGGRRGMQTCEGCHSTGGIEDAARYRGGAYATTADVDTTGITIDFRTMLHKIHMGEELTNASTYTVIGNSASKHTYGEVVFPAMPGKVKHCEKCHGTNASWKEPGTRSHTSATVGTRKWYVVCSACHDTTDVEAHAAINTSGLGTTNLEACGTCHGPGAENSVELRHKNR